MRVLIDLFDRYVLYKPAVDADLEGFYQIGALVAADDEGDLVLVGLWKPELFIEILVAKNILV